MGRRRYILVPPSEGKALGGEGPPWREVPGARAHPLFGARSQVAEALVAMLAGTGRRVATGELERFFGVKGEALARTLDADAGIDEAATLPAIERYDGVLYQHLAPGSMTGAQQARLRRDLRIVSGLWGVLAPDEAIPDYRLKMSATLAPMGRLSTWWRDRLTEFVGAESRGAELWNLLPLEHAAALGATSHRVVNTAVFLTRDRSGRLKAVSHWNKALKGELVAHLVRNPTARPEDLLDWAHPGGYRLDPASLEVVDGVRTLRFVDAG